MKLFEITIKQLKIVLQVDGSNSNRQLIEFQMKNKGYNLITVSQVNKQVIVVAIVTK